MTIDISEGRIFRMTHIDNIAHIVRWGITHKNSVHKNRSYVSIGDNSLIHSRDSYRLANGKLLGDYIPFYFGVRMPMLYVIQKGFNGVEAVLPEKIVYCVSRVSKLLSLSMDFIFTDGHAKSDLSVFYTKEQAQDLATILDSSAINKPYWKDENDLDLKRRKESELLVDGDIAPEGVLGYVVYNQNAKTTLENLGIDAPKIVVKPSYYF